MAMTPRLAITRNQKIITGPNSRPTRAVPRFWMKNNRASTASVTGITAFSKSGSSISSPSTALNTEIAGVISASQKKNAVPARARPINHLNQCRLASGARCASANKARIPPSPWLSARIMTVTYLNVTDSIRLQKMSDRQPSTASGSKPPVAFSAVSSAYSGLVPMSP